MVGGLVPEWFVRKTRSPCEGKTNADRSRGQSMDCPQPRSLRLTIRLGQDFYLSCTILLPLTNHRLIVQPLKTTEKYKYKAFISYRHSENGQRHAVALETALKRFAKPRFSLPMKIFRDEKHMKPDINLPRRINDGLTQSAEIQPGSGTHGAKPSLPTASAPAQTT